MDSSIEYTPRENSNQSPFYIQNPIMSTSLQYLVYFIQHRVLEDYLLQYQSLECDNETAELQ
jgi:hypothetical protein